MMFRAKTRRLIAPLSALIVGIGLVGCSDDNDTTQPSSQVRAIHAVPDAPPVNIQLSASEIVSGLDYAENSGFASVTAATYNIDVNAIVPGAPLTVIEVDGVALAANARTTIFAVGTVDAADDADPEKQLGAIIVPEPANEPTDTEVNIKVVHAAPVAADVDIYITAFGADLNLATPIDAGYLDSAELAAPVPAVGAYQVRITADGDASTVLYDSGTLDLSAFAGQSLLAAAMNTTTQTTQAASPVKLVVITDTTQAVFLDTSTQAGAKVVHLSPDAGDDAAGPVEVFANNAVELVPQFSYGETVPATNSYVLVNAGDYVFDVSPNDGTNTDSVFTSPTLTLAAGSESTVIAVGYVSPTTSPAQPAFDLLVVSDDARSYGTQARVKVVHGAAAVGNVDVYVATAGTFNSVNVTTSMMPQLSGVPFTGISDYLDLAAGSYDIFVAGAGTNSVAIEANNVAVAAGDVITIVARGADESAGATITTAGLLLLTN